MKKIVFIILSFHFTCLLYAQNDSLQTQKSHSVKDYPQGIYASYEDFINKKVTPIMPLERRTVYGDKRIHRDSIVDQVVFYTIADRSEYYAAFAISYQGQLYFKQREISKRAKKGEKSQEGNYSDSYHRVIKDGKFFYMEGKFANGFAKGLAYGTGGAVGGVIGSNLDQLKGVIFDFETNSFDFFKQCDDFNVFLKERKIPEYVYCNAYTISAVRRIIEKYIQ